MKFPNTFQRQLTSSTKKNPSLIHKIFLEVFGIWLLAKQFCAQIHSVWLAMRLKWNLLLNMLNMKFPDVHSPSKCRFRLDGLMSQHGFLTTFLFNSHLTHTHSNRFEPPRQETSIPLNNQENTRNPARTGRPHKADTTAVSSSAPTALAAQKCFHLNTVHVANSKWLSWMNSAQEISVSTPNGSA